MGSKESSEDLNMLPKKLRNLAAYSTVQDAKVEAGILNAAADEIEQLRARIAHLESDIDNAVRQSKVVQPEYPWDESHQHPASQAAWAVCSALQGTSEAISDHWVPLVNSLRDALHAIAVRPATDSASGVMKGIAKRVLKDT